MIRQTPGTTRGPSCDHPAKVATTWPHCCCCHTPTFCWHLTAAAAAPPAAPAHLVPPPRRTPNTLPPPPPHKHPPLTHTCFTNTHTRTAGDASRRYLDGRSSGSLQGFAEILLRRVPFNLLEAQVGGWVGWRMGAVGGGMLLKEGARVLGGG